MERLFAEIDNFCKQLELKYGGLLPWDAISEKLAVQDLFRYLSRVKKHAIVAHSSKYSSEMTTMPCLHGMVCSELSFWTKSIL